MNTNLLRAVKAAVDAAIPAIAVFGVRLPKLMLCIGLLAGAAAVHGELQVAPVDGVELGTFLAEAAPLASFELVNTGTEVVRIVRANSDCSCLEPVVYADRIAPGERIPLDVYVDGTQLSGFFEKTVSLTVAGTQATNVVLRIKGTARPAVSGLPRFVDAPRLAVGEAWETNLAFTVREDLQHGQAVDSMGNMVLEVGLVRGKERGAYGLHLAVPPSPVPLSWENSLLISFRGRPEIPAVRVLVRGYIGGTLHPAAPVMAVSSASATLDVRRDVPASAAQAPSPIHCDRPGVRLEESPVVNGTSTLQFHFPEDFMRQLKKDGRIPLQLKAAGFLPATIVAKPEQ